MKNYVNNFGNDKYYSEYCEEDYHLCKKRPPYPPPRPPFPPPRPPFPPPPAQNCCGIAGNCGCDMLKGLMFWMIMNNR